ncbi:MAG: YCF48-related protein, partial [Planctomycetota bacterium]|nr:YCF48-related protein [Planctomycetota bacterium]
MVGPTWWGSGYVVMRAVAAVIVVGMAVRISTANPAELNATAGDSQLLTALRHDAQLHDVFFVDPARGWAVGDRGAIWRTLDGGQHWALQNVQVDCPLKSVFFLNEKTGWAAGGVSDPYTQTTHGVLLRTDDGGHTWARWKRALLPALRQVKFVSPKEGWAIGQTSDLFPHGLFTTDDGGRTWTPVAPADGQVWLTGDFL